MIRKMLALALLAGMAAGSVTVADAHPHHWRHWHRHHWHHWHHHHWRHHR